MKKLLNEGFEVVVKNNGEQIDGFEHPTLERISEHYGCIAEADGSFDFGLSVISALRFSHTIRGLVGGEYNYTSEVFHVKVYEDDCRWIPLTLDIVKEYV